jgi:hypothetical protein
VHNNVLGGMMAEQKKKNKVGRPKKKVDFELLSNLAEIHCTDEELSSLLGVSVSYIEGERRKGEENSEFLRVYKTAWANGKKSLRRKQWEMAEEGNATMLVWLGKQILGQRDKRDIEQKTELKAQGGITIYVPENKRKSKEENTS